MRKDRLLKLADFLETVPEGAFNITYWEDRPATKPEGEKPGECGFAGCAVGWAAHAELFDGFKLSHNHGDAWPIYDGEAGFDAVIKLFEIDEQDAFRLFCGSYYDVRPSAARVADRIRALVSSSPEGAAPPTSMEIEK